VGECLAAIEVDREEALRRVDAEARKAVPASVRGADRDACAADLTRFVDERTQALGKGLWRVAGHVPLRNYLRGVAKRQALSRGRRAKREREVLRRLGGSEIDASDGPGDLAEREETRECVRKALAELSPRLREVVSGVLGGLSLRLIAHEAGLNEKTVDRRWASATKILRARLECDVRSP
jgi:RNA polymerase sigma factor (sigma-70 family)